MWLQAPNISCVHGFSLRHGGVSTAPFHTLNLGGQDDAPENIAENRHRALSALGLQNTRLSLLRQVHGTTVCSPSRQVQEGDALAGNQPGWALAVGAADCYPLLFHDPQAAVVAAAHAGWRGTLAGIGAKVVYRMQQLGAVANRIQVAIGPGICQAHFEVGQEVTDLFRAAGFPGSVMQDNRIDLVAANRFVLEKAGVLATHVWSANRCSFDDDFFSYRRDGGATGRMWGLISM